MSYQQYASPRSPPGVLPVPPTPNQVSGGFFSNNAAQGTQIDARGTIVISLLVDDLMTPFYAVRDAVRFLQSLYPDWSTPAVAVNSSVANDVGATYKLEHNEAKKVGEFDGGEKEVNVRRRKIITIKEIIDQPTFKVITYDVTSKIESDIFNDPFPSTTYIVVEIKAYPYEEGKYQFTITLDGGPPDVEATYCCFCISNPGTLKLQEDAQEMRPQVYRQANSAIGYIKSYNPNMLMARNVTAYNNVTAMNSSPYHGFGTSPSAAPMASASNRSKLMSPSKSSRDWDDQHSYNGSKVSSRSRGQVAVYQSPVRQSPFGSLDGGFSQTPSQAGSSYDEIKKLYDLLQMGAITRQEYEAEKRKVMNSSNNASGNIF